MGTLVTMDAHAPSKVFSGRVCNLADFYNSNQLRRRIAFYPILDKLNSHLKQGRSTDNNLRLVELSLSGTVQKAGLRAAFERLFGYTVHQGKIVDGPNNLANGQVRVKFYATPLEMVKINILFCPGRGYHLIAGSLKDAESGNTILVDRGEKVPKNAAVVWTSTIDKAAWKIETRQGGSVDLATFYSERHWLPDRFEISKVLTGIPRGSESFSFPRISPHSQLEGTHYTEWGAIPVYSCDGPIDERIALLMRHHYGIYGNRLAGGK
ncbi:MAG: hypothetical protein JW873_06875 [Candidatus Saganbacteria bacterium]|nr:hypothetical protein [Candidatus Saganbacteria bacterium]